MNIKRLKQTAVVSHRVFNRRDVTSFIYPGHWTEAHVLADVKAKEASDIIAGKVTDVEIRKPIEIMAEAPS